jgi:hypothetical protein
MLSEYWILYRFIFHSGNKLKVAMDV